MKGSVVKRRLRFGSDAELLGTLSRSSASPLREFELWNNFGMALSQTPNVSCA